MARGGPAASKGQQSAPWLFVLCLFGNCLPGLAAPPSWEELMSRGYEARKDYRWDEADRLLEAALKKAEQFGEQDPRLTASIRELADVCFAQKKFVRAASLYKRELKI